MTPDDGPDRLAIVIQANIALTLTAGCFTIAMSLTVARLPWLTFAGVAVLLTALVQTAALVPLRRGDTSGALVVYSISNWAIALIATFVVTFQWPVQVAVALMPIILVATFMPDRRMGGFIAASIVVSLGVAALGLLQDVTGLSDDIPQWLKTLVQLLVFPGFTVIVILAILQHHRRVNDVLAVEREAQALAEQRAVDLATSRRRLVQATDRARRAIERDLHDGAQSHLFGIDLQLTRAMALDDLESTRAALGVAQHELHRAREELRDVAHGLFPPVLSQRGLVPAIEDAADRFPLTVRLDMDRIDRAAPDVESALYFCVLEAMQNAVKHAKCDSVTVTVRAVGDELRVSVADDGTGLDTPGPVGHGLDNMHDRLGAVGGEVTIESRPGGGTEVVAVAPRASAPPSRG